MTSRSSRRPARADPHEVDQRTRRSPFNRIGPYLPAVIILSVAIPVVIYLLFMKSMGWNLPAIGVSGAPSFGNSASSDVIIYSSSNTKTYFSRIGGDYEVLLNPWRGYFNIRKLKFTEVQTPAQLRKFKGGVLVLPSAVSLSDEERFEILAFRSNGGAVLVTWATGSRNGKGDWQGWQFLSNLGFKVLGEISAALNANNLVLSGESAVAHSLAADQRIELSRTSEALLRAKGEMRAARFTNSARVVDDERRAEGAVIFTETTVHVGRAAFFAFAESAWEARPQRAYELIDNTLQWLHRDPALVRAAWPDGKRAAQVIEMDVDEGFANALPFASLLRSINYRGTFYILTSTGKMFPNVVTQLARDFDLGYHGDVHDSFKGQPLNIQEQRIQTMQSEMAGLMKDTKGITGFRAPFEGYDAATERLLEKSGFLHHTADPSRSNAGLPFLLKTEGVEPANALVVLPRTQRDDISLQSEKLNVEQTTKALTDDFDWTLETGALGVLSIHSQNFNADGVLSAALPGFLDHLKGYGAPVWLASAAQVADWWRDRERFKYSTSQNGKRLEFNITVTGTQPLKGATLVVMLPQKGAQPAVEALKIGMVKPVISRIDEYRSSLIFDSLAPGSYAYQLTFAPR